MPELPEVETVLQGLKPFTENQVIRRIVIRQPKLRWDITKGIERDLTNQKILKVTRRGKYILFHLKKETAILHFGMSGSLRLLTVPEPPQKHDHFDLIFDDFYLRYTDPRRFGSFLLTFENPNQHPLLADLGIEPLDPSFNGQYLYTKAKARKVGIKQFIMNHKIVVGVGNIYAAEALYMAKINPLAPAKQLTKERLDILARAIKKVLLAAIKKGGTTLKDFKNSNGKAGYFKQRLKVYDRAGQRCYLCKQLLLQIRIQNRSTVYCPHCQRF